MTIPMLFNVFPKPSDKLFIIISVSKPLTSPIPSEAIIKVKNGCILYLAVAKMMKAIVSAR